MLFEVKEWEEPDRDGGALTSHLPLLEGVSGQVASARRLEERDVPPGLKVALLLQPGQDSRSEEDLGEDRASGQRQTHAAAKYL